MFQGLIYFVNSNELMQIKKYFNVNTVVSFNIIYINLYLLSLTVTYIYVLKFN